jgi:hypothetical protein
MGMAGRILTFQQDLSGYHVWGEEARFASPGIDEEEHKSGEFPKVNTLIFR